MLKLTFYMKQVSEDVLVLRLFWGFRIVFLLLFALIAGSMYIPGDVSSAGSSPLAVILLILFAGIAVYDEKWLFNKPEGIVTHIHGIVILGRKTTFAVHDISHIEVSEFRKGSIGGEDKKRAFQRDLLRLSIVLSESGSKDIEITEKKNLADLRSKAAAIAGFMNLNYHSKV